VRFDMARQRQYKRHELSPFIVPCKCGKHRFDIRHGDKCYACRSKKKSEVWEHNKTWHDKKKTPTEIRVPDTYYHKDTDYKRPERISVA
jgi:hypothetical protein